jgi:hypothetical protein
MCVKRGACVDEDVKRTCFGVGSSCCCVDNRVATGWWWGWWERGWGLDRFNEEIGRGARCSLGSVGRRQGQKRVQIRTSRVRTWVRRELLNLQSISSDGSSLCQCPPSLRALRSCPARLCRWCGAASCRSHLASSGRARRSPWDQTGKPKNEEPKRLSRMEHSFWKTKSQTFSNLDLPVRSKPEPVTAATKMI